MARLDRLGRHHRAERRAVEHAHLGPGLYVVEQRGDVIGRVNPKAARTYHDRTPARLRFRSRRRVKAIVRRDAASGKRFRSENKAKGGDSIRGSRFP
ncbi:MAG: hypothetical protein AMXMBFR83_18510 [Phycisphaerae bacterium]